MYVAEENCKDVVKTDHIFEKKLTVSVGQLGLIIDFSESEGWLDLSDSQSIQPFVDSLATSNDFNLNLKIESRPTMYLEGPDLERPNWHYRSQGTQSSLYWRPPLIQGGWTHYIGLDLATGQGVLQLSQPITWPVLTYEALFPALLDKFIFTTLLNQLGGCLIHAASLADGPHGLLLAGDSGKGKSTSSRLWQKYGGPAVRCLTDESSLVRAIDGQFVVFGTPWPSAAKIADPGGVVLETIYFLNHAPVNQLRPIDSRATLLKLLPQGRFSYWDIAGVSTTLDFLVRLAETIPAFELGFVPDFSVINFVRSLRPTVK